MGRPPGAVNRTTTQRKLLVEHRATGVPLAKEILEEFMLFYVEAARKVIPKRLPLPDNASEAEHSNVRLFHSLAEKAAFYARALAPYQSPTYRSITVQAPREQHHGTPAIDALEAFVLTLAAVRKPVPEPKIIEPVPEDEPTLVDVKSNGGG